MNEKNDLHEVRGEQGKGDLRQAFGNLLGSFKYMFQSAAGRSSLESYLETIGEFTDYTIREAEKEGLTYIGGECSMKSNPENSTQILAIIELEFQTPDGSWKKKQAKRNLEKNTFTDDAIAKIGNGNGLKFTINPPTERA